MSWVRKGYCCRCGDCCIGTPDPEKIGEAVDGMCPLLKPGPDGTRICSVHDTDHWYWYNACRHWPNDPAQITHLPRCTFKFEWVDGN